MRVWGHVHCTCNIQSDVIIVSTLGQSSLIFVHGVF